MSKELLQVQEWTQKRGHTHTPITSVKGPGSTIGFLIYVPGRKQPLSFRMLVFVIKYWFLQVLTDLFVQLELFLEVSDDDLLILRWASLHPWSGVFVIKLT